MSNPSQASATSPTEVSRLDVLLHARQIAETKGAVKNGNFMFEDANGNPIAQDMAQGADVCGVCIAGALLLAEVELSAPMFEDVMDEAEDAAVQIASVPQSYLDHELIDDDDPAEIESARRWYSITKAVTVGGTPYVVSVLDAMIEAERETLAQPS